MILTTVAETRSGAITVYRTEGQPGVRFAVIRHHQCIEVSRNLHPVVMLDRQALLFLLEQLDATLPPDGLCGQRGDHAAHDVTSGSLAPYHCTGNEAARLPARAERERRPR